ncbi:MAG: hypothetical protein FJZ64_03855 [Chlamydiae bacterium]|nr:hypothetical protein [Chlamydiota bacterium]
MENKRLFFAFDLVAPWPEELPKGRILDEKDRHLTVAFLGDAPLQDLLEHLKTFPKPPVDLSLTGVFDRPIFLSKVAAWHVHFLEKEEIFLTFQKNFVFWLKSKNFHPKEKGETFLSHVTLARSPFLIHEWEKTFQKRPLFLRNLHLYESLGASKYQSHWSHSFLPPFEEKEHTADIAFTIRGTTLEEIHLHAEIALSFHFPPLINYLKKETFQNLEEIISSLNRIIAEIDQKEGSPFKAVSYHGNLKRKEILEWEMIVDV